MENISRERIRMELTVENLCKLLADLYDRGGVDDAIDMCLQYMEPGMVALLDEALCKGQKN